MTVRFAPRRAAGAVAVRAVAVAALGVVLFAPAASLAAETVTARKNADLRYEPRQGSAGESFVLAGERLELVEVRGEWMSVRTRAGDFGWMRIALATVPPSPPRPATPRGDGVTDGGDGAAAAEVGEAVGGPGPAEGLLEVGETIEAGLALDLLAEPRDGADTIERVRARESLEVLEVAGDWARLGPERGGPGWARVGSRPGDSASLQRLRLPGSHVVRRQATVVGAFVGRAGDGEVVTVVDERGDWLRIESSVGRGWIHAPEEGGD